MICFAVLIAANGIVGLALHRFAPIWNGLGPAYPHAEVIAFVTALAALVCGIGMLIRPTAAAASLVLFGSFCIWLVAVKVALLLRAPFAELSYQNFGMTAIPAVASWIFVKQSRATCPKPFARLARAPLAVSIARTILGLSLTAFGLSHFFYPQFTIPLVPQWLPAPPVWAALTGICFVAAGVALVANRFPTLAATLAALQMALFVGLIWLPMLLAGDMNAPHFTEFINTCVLSASAWLAAADLAQDNEETN